MAIHVVTIEDLFQEIQKLREDFVLSQKKVLIGQKELLTIKELALYLGCSESHVRQDLRYKLPVIRDGKKILFEKELVVDYFKNKPELNRRYI